MHHSVVGVPTAFVAGCVKLLVLLNAVPGHGLNFIDKIIAIVLKLLPITCIRRDSETK